MSHQDIGALLERLSSPRAERAWREFLESYADLLYQVVGLFERDEDGIADCFLFVCESLQQNDFRRLQGFEPEGPASFDTWLRAVTRNLCIDWRRKVFGRSRLFQVIDELSPVEQEVFRCLYHFGLTALETHRTLSAEYPSLTEERVDEIAAGFAQRLSSRQQWLESTRRPIEESLEAGPAAADEESDRPLATPDPSPEALAADAEERASLARGMRRLPDRSRLVLRLRFGQELPLREVGRLMDLAGPQGAARAVERALEELRGYMNEEARAARDD